MRHKGLTVSDDVVMQNAVELYNHYAESGGGEKICSMPVKGGLKILRSGLASRK
jgi:hypothetical protein